jgi:hypothetical protein
VSKGIGEGWDNGEGMETKVVARDGNVVGIHRQREEIGVEKRAYRYRWGMV